MRINTNITSLGIKAKRLFTELVQSSDWTIHPNGYSGRGRYASRTADHATTLADSLEELGLVRGRHFTTGNDAPRGGWSGEFVTLLPAGRRLKVVTDNRICVEGLREQLKTLSNNCNPRQGLLDYLADNPAEDTPSLDDFTAVEQNKLKDWYRNGCEHPCPDTVLAIKQKSRLSWRQVGDQCHAKWRPIPFLQDCTLNPAFTFGIDPESTDPDDLPCYRVEDYDGEWTCVHDHTGCLYNNGHNVCTHAGTSDQPLEVKERSASDV